MTKTVESKGRWKTFLGSFSFDSRFAKMFLWEAVLVAVMFGGLWIWANFMEGLGALMQQAAGPEYTGIDIANSIMMHNSAALMEEIQTKMIVYAAAIILYVVLLWPLFKALVYTTLVGKKLDRHLYGKFVLVEVVWTAVLAGVAFGVQYFIYSVLFSRLPYSAVARVSLLLTLILMFVLLCYFTMNLFIALVRSKTLKDMLKSYFQDNIRGIRHFLVPILFSFLMFVVLNLIMQLIAQLPKTLSFIINTGIVLCYIVWLKQYYAACTPEVASGAVGKRQVEKKPAHRVVMHKKHVV